MSILIKGMDMPKGCTYCPMLEGDRDDGLCHAASRWLDDDEYWRWYMYPEGDVDDSIPLNCPLIEVPTPHGRLIDADALKVSLVFAEKTAKWAVPALRAVLMVIDEMPIIIEAEEE